MRTLRLDAHHQARRSGTVLAKASGFASQSGVLVCGRLPSALENTIGNEAGVSPRGRGRAPGGFQYCWEPLPADRAGEYRTQCVFILYVLSRVEYDKGGRKQ
jgi:hypothetical protein